VRSHALFPHGGREQQYFEFQTEGAATLVCLSQLDHASPNSTIAGTG
jgi:hypothetical protein